MSESLNICLPCGLCCDGTLIGHVQLDGDEIPALKKIMDIEEVEGNGFFLHPCKSLCGVCSIYENRPKKCDEFNCKPLTSVEQKELTFESGMKTINEVKEKKIEIEKKIELLDIKLKSQSFYFRIVELTRLFLKIKSESTLTEKQLELMSEIEALEKLITSKFGVSMKK